MKRLFIAIPIFDAARMQIVHGILNDEYARKLPVNWTSYQNLHLTIQFLGDVEEKRIPDLRNIMNNLPGPDQPQYLEFERFGAFPNMKSPRVLLYHMKENEYLRKMHKELTGSLKKSGFAPDQKPFKPHLTLGRVRRNVEIPESAMNTMTQIASGHAIEKSPVDRICLFESLLRPNGPIYTVLYEKKLTSAAPIN